MPPLFFFFFGVVITTGTMHKNQFSLTALKLARYIRILSFIKSALQ